jgi:hypothetical protein|uniref:Uncharacterized protein n=1 Tax=Populus trichocarpa TaxID=3694 RepID=A0A2K2BBP0_POPTR
MIRDLGHNISKNRFKAQTMEYQHGLDIHSQSSAIFHKIISTCTSLMQLNLTLLVFIGEREACVIKRKEQLSIENINVFLISRL